MLILVESYSNEAYGIEFYSNIHGFIIVTYVRI